MYSVYIKKKNGQVHNIDDVFNISAVKEKLSIVVKDHIYTFRPSDLEEVKFLWNAR